MFSRAQQSTPQTKTICEGSHYLHLATSGRTRLVIIHGGKEKTKMDLMECRFPFKWNAKLHYFLAEKEPTKFSLDSRYYALSAILKVLCALIAKNKLYSDTNPFIILLDTDLSEVLETRALHYEHLGPCVLRQMETYAFISDSALHPFLVRQAPTIFSQNLLFYPRRLVYNFVYMYLNTLGFSEHKPHQTVWCSPELKEALHASLFKMKDLVTLVSIQFHQMPFWHYVQYFDKTEKTLPPWTTSNNYYSTLLTEIERIPVIESCTCNESFAKVVKEIYPNYPLGKLPLQLPKAISAFAIYIDNHFFELYIKEFPKSPCQPSILYVKNTILGDALQIDVLDRDQLDNFIKYQFIRHNITTK